MKRANTIVRSGGIALLLPLLTMMPLAFAQAPGAPGPPQPEFEAVSIHLVEAHSLEDLTHGRGLFSMSTFPTNLFTLNNAPLTFLIQMGYDVDSQDHIAGMPSWMDSQQYSISAKVEGNRQLTLEEMRPMLLRLLAQRFHFTAHHETRVVSGFAMVVAKGGLRIQPDKDDGKPFAQILPNRVDIAHMDAKHIAGVLAHRAGQTVVDQTGLTGTYDFKLSFAPLEDANSSLPNFFTAVQEQLGLKLESQKVPVDFLVIDHVEKIPTEN